MSVSIDRRIPDSWLDDLEDDDEVVGAVHHSLQAEEEEEAAADDDAFEEEPVDAPAAAEERPTFVSSFRRPVLRPPPPPPPTPAALAKARSSETPPVVLPLRWKDAPLPEPLTLVDPKDFPTVAEVASGEVALDLRKRLAAFHGEPKPANPNIRIIVREKSKDPPYVYRAQNGYGPYQIHLLPKKKGEASPHSVPQMCFSVVRQQLPCKSDVCRYQHDLAKWCPADQKKTLCLAKSCRLIHHHLPKRPLNLILCPGRCRGGTPRPGKPACPFAHSVREQLANQGACQAAGDCRNRKCFRRHPHDTADSLRKRLAVPSSTP